MEVELTQLLTVSTLGMYLAGGGSMLRGLDKRLSKKTDLPSRSVVNIKIVCLNHQEYKLMIVVDY